MSRPFPEELSTGRADLNAISRPDGAPDLAAGLDAAVTPLAKQLGEFLAASFGPSTVAVIHYGSRAQRFATQPQSAHDFFVIVDDEAAAYRMLARRARLSFSPLRANAFARILAPNVVALAAPLGAAEWPLKCVVYSAAEFQRATGPEPRDHFAQGRLCQHVLLAWARDEAAYRAARDAILRVRRQSFAWVRPSLPASFDAEGYVRTMLARSFAAEIRPEAGERIDALVAAQREVLASAYGALLNSLHGEGKLRRTQDGRYGLVDPVTTPERRRVSRYFARSKMRATLRWGKYMMLYDGWLDYAVGKIDRRSSAGLGTVRRFLFFWPRLLHTLVYRRWWRSDQSARRP